MRTHEQWDLSNDLKYRPDEYITKDISFTHPLHWILHTWYIVSRFAAAIQVAFALTSCTPTFFSSAFTSSR